MGRALLNIWVKDINCNVLKDSWRMDLVIQKCNGSYLVDFDTDLVPRLNQRYPDYEEISVLPNYQGATRIKIRPGLSRPIYHVEVEAAPGEYKIWARMCFGANEETNKVIVTARCDDHICVNLLLDREQTCAHNGILPIGIQGLQHNMPHPDIEIFMKVMKGIAGLRRLDLLNNIDNRIGELGEPGAPQDLLPKYQDLRAIVEAMPDEPYYCC